MGRFWLFFFIANIILTAAALISCLSAEEGAIKGLPRIGWVIVILLFPPIGSIAWFLAGREQSGRARPDGWRPGFPENQRPRRTVAPDDDPDFLKGIDRNRAEQTEAQHAAAKQSEEENELLRKWEADLKRREEEMRKKDKPDEA